MAEVLQYLKCARKCKYIKNESLNSGYFGIDCQLHLFTEMDSIFFAFLVKRRSPVITCMLMVWLKYASIVYENGISALQQLQVLTAGVREIFL